MEAFTKPNTRELQKQQPKRATKSLFWTVEGQGKLTPLMMAEYGWLGALCKRCRCYRPFTCFDKADWKVKQCQGGVWCIDCKADDPEGARTTPAMTPDKLALEAKQAGADLASCLEMKFTPGSTHSLETRLQPIGGCRMKRCSHFLPECAPRPPVRWSFATRSLATARQEVNDAARELDVGPRVLPKMYRPEDLGDAVAECEDATAAACVTGPDSRPPVGQDMAAESDEGNWELEDYWPEEDDMASLPNTPRGQDGQGTPRVLKASRVWEPPPDSLWQQGDGTAPRPAMRASGQASSAPAAAPKVVPAEELPWGRDRFKNLPLDERCRLLRFMRDDAHNYATLENDAWRNRLLMRVVARMAWVYNEETRKSILFGDALLEGETKMTVELAQIIGLVEIALYTRSEADETRRRNDAFWEITNLDTKLTPTESASRTMYYSSKDGWYCRKGGAYAKYNHDTKGGAKSHQNLCYERWEWLEMACPTTLRQMADDVRRRQRDWCEPCQEYVPGILGTHAYNEHACNSKNHHKAFEVCRVKKCPGKPLADKPHGAGLPTAGPTELRPQDGAGMANGHNGRDREGDGGYDDRQGRYVG